nr:MAG TPA: hypothetical protein [Caudoviricetes sp.]
MWISVGLVSHALKPLRHNGYREIFPDRGTVGHKIHAI